MLFEQTKGSGLAPCPSFGSYPPSGTCRSQSKLFSRLSTWQVPTAVNWVPTDGGPSVRTTMSEVEQKSLFPLVPGADGTAELTKSKLAAAAAPAPGIPVSTKRYPDLPLGLPPPARNVSTRQALFIPTAQGTAPPWPKSKSTADYPVVEYVLV